MNLFDAINAADFLKFSSLKGQGQVVVIGYKPEEFGVLAQVPDTHKVVWLYDLDDESRRMLKHIYGETEDRSN